jgi:phage-related protein
VLSGTLDRDSDSKTRSGRAEPRLHLVRRLLHDLPDVMRVEISGELHRGVVGDLLDLAERQAVLLVRTATLRRSVVVGLCQIKHAQGDDAAARPGRPQPGRSARLPRRGEADRRLRPLPCPEGGKHPDAKPLRGFGGAGVLEVVDEFAGGTYRAVYTVRFASAVYVLHAFQKKFRRGIATPKQELDLIRARLRRTGELDDERSGRMR